jgi:hypothetical protein
VPPRPWSCSFDLTFVVAVARVAAEFSHAVVTDDLGHCIAAYLMVFFAIYFVLVSLVHDG